MARKKRNRLVPVMMQDIIGGQEYLNMRVSVDGQMWLKIVRFFGQPFIEKDGDGKKSWWIKTSEGVLSITDLGMNPNRFHNQHRVFRYTERNLSQLRYLVDTNDIALYLELIRVVDIDEVLLRMLEESYRFDAELDDYISNPDGRPPNDHFDEMYYEEY